MKSSFDQTLGVDVRRIIAASMLFMAVGLRAQAEPEIEVEAMFLSVEERVPVLGAIPLLGRAFRSERPVVKRTVEQWVISARVVAP